MSAFKYSSKLCCPNGKSKRLSSDCQLDKVALSLYKQSEGERMSDIALTKAALTPSQLRNLSAHTPQSGDKFVSKQHLWIHDTRLRSCLGCYGNGCQATVACGAMHHTSLFVSTN
eukprot:4029546-Pleurochrysis_carterae.AAC.1